MSESTIDPIATPEAARPAVNSLRELIDLVTGRKFQEQINAEDVGPAERLPYPFLGVVGQNEMKLALLIAVINPLVSGVLLVGPRGTGKTTMVRSLADLLPQVRRSACYYGCLPEDIETGGLDAVCPDCARKYGEGRPLTIEDRAHLIDLPLNARLEDVVGGVDERATAQHRFRIQGGILRQADLNVLYVDEVNLLNNEIVNAILDAAAQGAYTVRRGAVTGMYRSRFTLIGSMNPEEGTLRPQILDRFGLRVIVHGLSDASQRLEAYHHARTYRLNQRAFLAAFAAETALARDEIMAAQALLPQVKLPAEVASAGTRLIQALQIDSLRADLTLFEAARAYAAADARSEVTPDDLRVVAPMTLRLRQSDFMRRYLSAQETEESQLREAIDALDHA